jgi:transaldolase
VEVIMTHTVRALRELGQSVWLDFIERTLLTSGELGRLIKQDGLAGMTSNPTIFQKAISSGNAYDDQIREAATTAKSDVEVFEDLAVRDIQTACDLFRPLYDSTAAGDGLVSIEVSPRLASDTEGSITEARRLWKEVRRPNLMVKIPGTREGLPAIEQCLAEGMNINITLLFAVERYEEVIEAYFSGLERRVRQNQPIDRIASVASFFVSRVDTKVDKALAEIAGKDAGRKAEAETLMGKIAVANAKVAYEAFEKSLRTKRWEALAKKGARAQRPLWASTSTKNPAYPDVYYVEALIGPHTVDTMPPETLKAYLDHGQPEVRVNRDLSAAHDAVARLEKLGIPLERVTRELEQEGVKAFSDSFDQLLKSVAKKKEALRVA